LCSLYGTAVRKNDINIKENKKQREREKQKIKGRQKIGESED
jgi:hypothetical protein